MKNIILTVSYGSHTDCLTITQKSTWSDLCASIFDYSRHSVTQLYYRDREGDIIAFSSDGELDSLKRRCTTGWLHLSTDPTNTIRWVFDDSFVNQGDIEQQSIPKNRYPTNSTSTPIPFIVDNITTPSFTSQFEQFGKLMDKYNDLIKQNEQVKAMMHQTATEITLQPSKVDLAELESRLEKYQGSRNSTKELYPLRSKLSSGSLGNTSIGLSRSATTATASSRRAIRRTPTVSLYHDYDNSNDQPWLTPTTSYPDVPPPSYEAQQSVTSTQHHYDTSEKRKREQRRHTHYGNFDQHSFPSSSWGEWPAYSSLHPPPRPSQDTNDTVSSSPPPLPSAPKLHSTPPPSAPSSPPASAQHHQHHHQQQQHSQCPPMSLYPRPPILPALLKRTSRLLSHWVPPLTTSTPPSPPSHVPLPSTAETIFRSTSAMNNTSSRPYYDDNDKDAKHPYTNNGDDGCTRKQKGKQHDNSGRGKDRHQHGRLDAIRNRQMYKEQQRTLRQQQKELERTRRRLKRQEKEHRRQQRHTTRSHDHRISSSSKTYAIGNNQPLSLEQHQQERRRQVSRYEDLPNGLRAGSSSYDKGSSSSMRKPSLSSISSLSSQSTCSSISSSSSSSACSSSPQTLEKTQQSSPVLLDHTTALRYPSIPTSLIQHSSSLGNGQQQQYREGSNDDQSLDEKDMQYLANAFNLLSTTHGDDPPLVPRKQ